MALQVPKLSFKSSLMTFSQNKRANANGSFILKYAFIKNILDIHADIKLTLNALMFLQVRCGLKQLFLANTNCQISIYIILYL